ncbi:MAG: hypothetical protein ACM3SU_18325 [Acidobacteriota bacterium]
MRGPGQGFPRTLSGLVAAAGIALAGCTVRIDCQTALQGIPTVEQVRAPDVAIAVVTKDGHVFPKRLIVRGGEHAIVWVADGQALSIVFEAGAPIRPECSGAICVVKDPPAKPAGEPVVYKYKGTVTPKESGKPVNFDPGLEVVK